MSTTRTPHSARSRELQRDRRQTATVDVTRVSRRGLLQAGAALVGAGALTSLPTGTAVAADGGVHDCGVPHPVPGFSPLIEESLGVQIPFFLPAEVDPFGGAVPPRNPATIGDFHGVLALVEADGVSDATRNSDEVSRRWACDVRFMEGVFTDRDGHTRRAGFGFF